MFYWAPDWISVPTLGSPWENVTLFNFTGDLLSSISVFDSTTSNIQIQNGEAYSFWLYQNYPNPFNSNTVIKYKIPIESFITLKLFDVLGNEVATLVDEFKVAGSYEQELEAEDLPSGIYFFILRTDNFTNAKKMILLS